MLGGHLDYKQKAAYRSFKKCFLWWTSALPDFKRHEMIL